LYLISIIGKGQNYHAEVVWIAVHLHDWGGYAKWMETDMEHALSSRQVAEAFWAEKSYPESLLGPILECIESHHSGDPHRSIEAILLSDADALDFFGVVGVLRDFSKKSGIFGKHSKSCKAARLNSFRQSAWRPQRRWQISV
jgi:hypothetical protein